MGNRVIQFDYESSPYAAKTRLLLEVAGISFARCDQPRVLPRPDLEKLGITYRRIPVLAVGKDVYADSKIIIHTILHRLGGAKQVATSPVDNAFEAWGGETFQAILPIVRAELLTPDFIKDRQTCFPILKRSDFKTLRPSALSEFRSRCVWVEETLLKDGKYIAGGDELSMADIHIIWVMRWAFFSLGVQDVPGFAKDDFPKLWAWMGSVPESNSERLSIEEASRTILEANYEIKDVRMDEKEPLGLQGGAPVEVESMDSEPGSHPQAGSLIGSNEYEVILGLKNGIHLHFPREGYIVRAM